MLDALLRTAHLLAAIVWIGGMVFAHFCLRPSLAVIEPPPQRLALMRAVLGRFFAWVAGAALLAVATGVGMAARRGWALAPSLWLMAAGGLVMLVIFGGIRHARYPRLCAALDRGAPAEAAAQLASIRAWVLVNLVIGTVIVVAAGVWR